MDVSETKALVEIQKTIAEIEKINAETRRIGVEIAKMATERRWYPVVISLGLFSAAAAFAKLMM
ncbi:MAG: hypothetical protein LBP58_09550 [Azoarcus sp.]|nr:hypothetical protein [Azoarcus sp.]